MSKNSHKHSIVKNCIFCGGTEITGEHIVPDWVQKVLPRDPSMLNHQTVRLSINNVKGKLYLLPQTFKTSGHTFSQKLNVVCEKCNRGWMSIMQTESKPILTPLILGEPRILTRDDLTQISKWATMAAMVAEYDDLDYKRIPIDEVEAFYFDKKVPNGWKIWIGRHEGTTAGYQHAGSDILIASLNFNLSYCQASIFTIGKFYIYI